MPIIPGLEKTFNQIPQEYDRWRPAYPDDLYEDIFRYKPVGRESDLLEIGMGTGQGTKPFLERDCSLTAVELGDNLAAFAKRKFSPWKNLSIINSSFETASLPQGSFDLVYSASAFHWIPEEIGYPRVFALLREGGAFARFANNPYRDKGRDRLHREMQEVYARHMPGSKPEAEFDGEKARKRAQLLEEYGFSLTEYHLYGRTRTFTADGYVSLLGTYSDHLALGERAGKVFFNEMREVILANGDRITVYDTIDLELGTKLS